MPVALVTGTRTGIGHGIAAWLVDKGYRVFGVSRRPIDEPIEGAYNHHQVDVTDERAVTGLVRAIAKETGRLDVLINNAGTASMNHFLLTSGETLERVLRTNVTSVFVATREAAKVMRRRRFGRIVNLTTVAVPMVLAGESTYVASKSAVEALTRVVAMELGPFGITCNALGPTPIRTELLRGVPDETINSIVERCAIRRPGEMRDVLNVIEFFLRSESDAVTGQVIYLGGIT